MAVRDRDKGSEQQGKALRRQVREGLSMEVHESHSQGQSWPMQGREDSEQKGQQVLWPEMGMRLRQYPPGNKTSRELSSSL